MGLFDFGKHDRRELERLLEEAILENQRLTKIIDKLINPQKHSVHLVLTQNINQTKSILMALTLATNQTSTGTLGLIDSVTQQPVTATFDTQTYVSSDVTIFTAAAGTDPNTVVITPVAAGSATLNVSANASYTDSAGNAQVSPETASVSVTVTAVVTADAVTLVVNFSTPAAKK
jgi:cell fate (sporulation/competence/biofilm development) regulator YmcA (YheA/YmcA/DUF963 family)